MEHHKNDIYKALHKFGIVIFFVILLLIVSFGLFQLHIGRSLIIDLIVDTIPKKVDVKAGEELSSWVKDKRNPQVEVLEKELNGLAKPLYNTVHRSSFSYDLKMISSPMLNAFALPGGNIFVTKEFLRFVKTPEELLGVVAHEIAHIEKRHTMKMLVSSLSIGVTFSLIFGANQHFISALGKQGAGVLQKSYSRVYEKEADQLSIQYLMKANLKPEGLISFLKRINNKKHKMEMPEFLMTHPNTLERIKNIKKEIRSYEFKNFREINFNLKKLKSKLSSLSS